MNQKNLHPIVDTIYSRVKLSMPIPEFRTLLPKHTEQDEKRARCATKNIKEISSRRTCLQIPHRRRFVNKSNYDIRTLMHFPDVFQLYQWPTQWHRALSKLLPVSIRTFVFQLTASLLLALNMFMIVFL